VHRGPAGVEGVDLVAVTGASECEREGRPQIPHRDVKPAAEVRDREELPEPLGYLWARHGLDERSRVVIDVAAVADVAGPTNLPGLLVRETPQEAVEDRIDARPCGGCHDGTKVEVDGHHSATRRASEEAGSNDADELRENFLALREEIDQAPLVDGDDRVSDVGQTFSSVPW